MMEGPLPGATNGISSPATPPPPTFDPQVLLDHLANLVTVTLGATLSDLEEEPSLLSPSERDATSQRVSRFASDSQAALYVRKDLEVDTIHTNGTNGTALPAHRAVYSVSSDISFSATSVGGIAILKASPQPLDPQAPITSQVQVIHLPGIPTQDASATAQGSSVAASGVLHAYLHLALAPYFEALTKHNDTANRGWTKGDSDALTGIPGTKRKIAELELNLLQLQQNVEIPALSLALHPLIQVTVDEAISKGVVPSSDSAGFDLQDPHILNQLQASVNGWIKSIRTITEATRDPAQGTASQEINFWLVLESRLEDIESQLRGQGVVLTLDILKGAKRFGTAISFSTDTKLKERTELVQRYNLLMRDFPLDELLSATTLQKVKQSIDQIFLHINKKLRICPYPIQRALPFVEAISGDLDDRIHSLVHGRSLMHLEFGEFQEVMRNAEDIWTAWEFNVKEFTNVARDVTRKRNDRFIPIRIAARHVKTQDRLKYINNFRHNHEQLQRTIVNVLGPTQSTRDTENLTNGSGPVIVEEIGDVDAVDEVSQAYNALKDVDVLDFTSEGTRIWAHAEELYNERTARVENSIIARLRDRLATAKTANEMFRVFSKFNALFVRPKIRGAISEYQTQLIESVKSDIQTLHDRFKLQYGHSEASIMASSRDLPPVSGAIIWARQIEKQLDGYMRKVEDILGENWSLHSEGQKLQNESRMFRTKLETRPIFDSWYQNVVRRNLSISGRLFTIVRNRNLGNALEIQVNFDPQVITLFKEVRNLLWLNFQVPHAINNVSKEAKRVYPYAVSMMESIRAYSQTQRAIGDIGEVAILLSGYQNDARSLISKGVYLRWESFVHAYDLHVRPGALAAGESGALRSESKHVQFVREFAEASRNLEKKTVMLATTNLAIQSAISELETCSYTERDFRQHLDAIQIAVDTLNFENFVNLSHWVSDLNLKIETVLASRLQSAINDWIDAFLHSEEVQRPYSSHTVAETDAPQRNRPRLEQLVLEISMRNQVIFLEPPLQYARAAWVEQLHAWIGIICNLSRIEASRYQHRVQTLSTSTDQLYTELPVRCIDSLSRVYNVIEERIETVDAYIAKWLQFQSLWDLQAEQVYDTLGHDLAQWLQLLQEIRKTRSTFDTSEVSRSFGNVTVDYEQAQVKVNAKYDQWQHDTLLRFASKLGNRMVEVFADLKKTREDLEGQALDSSSTGSAVAFITAVQQCERKVKTWAPEIAVFGEGQTLLLRQRHQFPADWLYVDSIDHEWAVLNDILDRKAKVLQGQKDALRAQTIAEDKLVHQRILDISVQWSEEKPVSGTVPPEEAALSLQKFNEKLTQLQTESENVARAKEALDLPPTPETVLTTLLEEVQDFQSVWAALGKVWSSINELREASWNSIQPRKLRNSLDDLIKITKAMPSRMRQYAAFEHVQNKLRQLLKMNSLLSDMRSDAVRERHWNRIFKTLKPSKRYSQLSMTLGDVWDLNLAANEAIIRDVIVQAQGEMALEEFLARVRETWQNYGLDLVNYHNKCRLIRGWDDLFAKCSEDLNSLQAMRHSPYYKEFEEEASLWEEKLNRVHVLFDVWIDVQRQWVYLEGVFSGNADIKVLLPVESQRFHNIDNEFLSVMRKVAKTPFVLEVLGIQGVQKSLERLAELLNKIQKALGEYLERERVSFPRFYFVGDEDLLEIIGNSNDTGRVSKHLRKMFAGLASLTTADEGTTILGFVSKEGEEVTLKRDVSLVRRRYAVGGPWQWPFHHATTAWTR